MTGAILPADWPAPPGVVAFTTLRSGAGSSQAPFAAFNLGARCGDDAGTVDANRRELVERFGLPSPPVWLRQVHGIAVHRAGAGGPADGEPEADAAVTDLPGVVLAILTADCLPVLFCRRDGGAVGVAHAGWRGLAAGVLEATVAAMPGEPGELLGGFGAHITQPAFEFGPEVRDAFVAQDAGASAAFERGRGDRWHADLAALARRRLARAGVTAVYAAGRCTVAEPAAFYSYRRARETGRMATLIWRN